MVLCRFFQQGNCRYGNSCRYDHIQGDTPNQYSNYRTPNNQSPYTLINKQTPTTPISNTQLHELATYLRTIMSDMFSAEQGKQWLLTSYGPMKGKPNFPEFTDVSFEEVRWSIYEATDDAKQLHHVMSNYAKMQQDSKEKFKKYQTESLELNNIIKTIYLKQETLFGGSNTQSNIFGQSTFGKSPLAETQKTNFGTSPMASNFSFTQNVFATTAQSSNIFSSAVTTQSGNIFSSTQENIPNLFLQPTTQTGSLFGDQPVPNFNQATQFGQNPSFGNPPFGGGFQTPTQSTFPPPYTSQSQETNIFSQQVTTQANMFAQPNQQVTTQANIFAQPNQQVTTQANMFSQPNQQVTTQANMFSQPNQQVTTQPNVFSQSNQQTTTQANVFSQPNQQVTTFSQPNQQVTTQANMFSQPNQQVPTQANIFAQGNTPSGQGITTQANIFSQGNVPVNQNGGIFGKESQQSRSIFGNASVSVQSTQNDVYTKLEDLEAGDLEAFKSEVFQFGKIPSLPPPLSLCQ